MRSERWLLTASLSILLAFLLLVVSGCGILRSVEQLVDTASDLAEEHLGEEKEEGTVEEETVEEEPGDDDPEDEDPDIQVTEWKNPTELDEIAAMFERFEYEWTDISGDRERTNTVVYEFQGIEQVGDVEAEKLMIRFDDNEVVVWVDGDGNTVQGEIDGELLPEEAAESVLGGALASAFWPFMMADGFNIPEMIGSDDLGAETTVVETTRQQIGNMRVDVTTVRVTLGPPIAQEEVTLTWGIGDFGDFQMLVHWTGEEGHDQAGFRLEIIDVALR